MPNETNKIILHIFKKIYLQINFTRFTNIKIDLGYISISNTTLC